jgi:hypothetical protein
MSGTNINTKPEPLSMLLTASSIIEIGDVMQYPVFLEEFEFKFLSSSTISFPCETDI